MSRNPAELLQILNSTKTIASVGLSSNILKESYWIVHYLQFQGYTIFPVNPTADEILGVKAYPDLASVPEEPDVVQVFRRPEDVPPVVEAAIARGTKVIWMQEGIAHEGAAEMARAAGLKVVMSTCMRTAHQVLVGDKKGWGQSLQKNESWMAYLQQVS